MQLFSGKIDNGIVGVTSTLLPLTYSNNRGIEMATSRITKTCTIVECARSHYAQQLCKKHYNQLHRTGDCSVPQCRRPLRAKGYCSTHYKTLSFNRPCKQDGCPKSANGGHGLCPTHYSRFYKHGDAETARTNWGHGNTPEDRFWSKVAITANPDKCWLWQGSVNNKGYGKFDYRKKRYYAHRLAWKLANGREPALWVLHSCDTPLCVNPSHLREGTALENSKDMVRRGRAKFGGRTIPMTVEVLDGH